MEITEKVYKELLDNLVEGIYFIDVDGEIVHWNSSAEKITGFSKSDAEGKKCFDRTISCINESGFELCKNACPLEAAVKNGITFEKNVFIRHKDGYRIPVKVKAIPLFDDDGKIIGAAHVIRDNSPIQERRRQMSDPSMVDQLTGLGNQKFIQCQLDMRFMEQKLYGWTFGILFIDIDNLQSRVNDVYGQNVGDEVIKMVGHTLARNSRANDIIGRWARDEFVAIIADASVNDLIAIGKRYLALVERSSLMQGANEINVTVSIGAAVSTQYDNTEKLRNRAEQMMYDGKRQGRNIVAA